jgi:hypothetical protein
MTSMGGQSKKAYGDRILALLAPKPVRPLHPRGANQPLVNPSFFENMRFSQVSVVKPLGPVYTYIQLSVGFVTRSRANLNNVAAYESGSSSELAAKGREFRTCPARCGSKVMKRLPGRL